MGEQATGEGAGGGSYAGLPGAFPYAIRHSESRLFRAYAVAGGLLGLGVAVLLVLALVVWLANPVGLVGERALLGVLALLVLGPLFAPVLLVARRHRRGGGDPRYDLALGLAGFGFLLSLWLALVVSTPPGLQSEPTGVLAPVASALYGLPRRAALAPPVLGAALVVAAHRLFR